MNVKIKSKFWIEVDGKPVFGRGRRCLLEAIDKHGSINQAAKDMNISYRKAWGYLKATEERLGMILVERQIGGKDGGGAILTKNARTILKKYRDMEKGLQKIVEGRFQKIFRKNGL
jgi:molybdate transport system regulatory protein